MKSFFFSRLQSVGYAIQGWLYVIRTQKNAWIHLIITILVLVLGFLFRLSRIEWGLIVGCIAWVWSLEFINTAIEAVVDLASPEKQQLAKIGKDVSASAVFFSAICAAVIGILILGPPAIRAFQGWIHALFR